jgi:diguanylate cyclase (GGDEF)-like protein
MIDDQVSITQYYQQMLEFHGFDFKSLTEPSGLLELLEDFDPDIFLLDYHLEQYSGAEIARLIRQLPALESTPIVFLTAESVEQLKTNLVELGSDDVMRKDIKPDAFISQLTSRIKRGRKLRQQMKQDSLTQLYNHGYIQTVAQQLYSLSQRKKTPCCFVMLDLDHFKSVNDRFGHAAGDRVLTALAQLLQQRLRNSDAIGRYGGEEFLLVMPDTAAADAFVVLNDIRLKFSQLVFSEANSSFQCTFSAGLVNSPLFQTAQQALEAADALLYQAKIAGRDQVKA